METTTRYKVRCRRDGTLSYGKGAKKVMGILTHDHSHGTWSTGGPVDHYTKRDAVDAWEIWAKEKYHGSADAGGIKEVTCTPFVKTGDVYVPGMPFIGKVRPDSPPPPDPLDTFQPTDEFERGVLWAAKQLAKVEYWTGPRSIVGERLLVECRKEPRP